VSGSQRDHFYPPRQRKLQTMRSRIVEWKATIVFFVALLGALSVAIGSKGDSESLPTVASHVQRHMRVLTADNDIAEFGASIFIVSQNSTFSTASLGQGKSCCTLPGGGRMLSGCLLSTEKLCCNKVCFVHVSLSFDK
jgi:hypothetical protein